jgi:hypothetical protein
MKGHATMSTSSTSTSEQAAGALGALTICHDYAGGTTVVGTEKGSPAHHALRDHGSWVWAPSAEAWLLRSSRHLRPKEYEIRRMEGILSELGYTVTRDIDEAMPTVEQQEADLAERMERRAERSDTAATHMGARNSPVTVANRIETLRTRRRAIQRRLDGGPEGKRLERLTANAAELDEHIAYWVDFYEKLQAEGKASTAGPHTVSKGDWVRVRGHWYPVRRSNVRTVSVPNAIFSAPESGEREYTRTTPWHEVQEYRTTEQMPAAFVEAYETPGVDRLRLDPRQFPEDIRDGDGDRSA